MADDRSDWDTIVADVKRLSDNPKVDMFDISRSIKDVLDEVLRLELIPVKLQGDKKLFTERFSFRNAPKNFTALPSLVITDGILLGDLFQVSAVEVMRLEQELSIRLTSIVGFLEAYRFDDDVEKPDRAFYQKLFRCFLQFPCVSFREVYFKEHEEKMIVSGTLDIVSGLLRNGTRPKVSVEIENNRLHTVYLGCIGEAKNTSVRQSASLPGSRTDEDRELKPAYQPILQLCATAELCTFTDARVPLINIYGSRETYKPYLYFKAHDVMLTCQLPAIIMENSGSRARKYNLHGLVLMELLFRLHKYPAEPDVLHNLTQCGWREAMNARNPTAYNLVKLCSQEAGAENQGSILIPTW